MADTKTIKEAFERNKKAVKLRPSAAKSTGKSTIRVRDGTTCEIEGAGWNLTADIGTEEGGNNAGPGPGVLERAVLGSCLAMGYVQMAAVMEVPVEKIEVEVETDFDARGMFDIEEQPPGFTTIRYTVHIESLAPEVEVQKVIDAGDNHSPVLDDFRRPIPVKREIIIMQTKTSETS
ncbi:MAG TPA: OsmC family protein [Fodinibius sp.]|nr:OsmC family protein [Fodinibius sp.]